MKGIHFTWEILDNNLQGYVLFVVHVHNLKNCYGQLPPSKTYVIGSTDKTDNNWNVLSMDF